MASLTEAFPDAKIILALEPEELGDVIFELIHKGISSNPGRFNTSDILYAVNNRNTPEWPSALRDQVAKAVGEAVAWLEHAGLVMFDPTQPPSTFWRTLTRRGEKLRTRDLAAAYRQAAILPTGLVHPEILRESESAFLRGDHDIAVFAAFKAIEVAVRTAGGFGVGELGVPLMRKAFHSDTGPLTDKAAVVAEREAMLNLFAGAIGAAKNPASHRDVEMSKVEAARLILFASYLMSIVEARRGSGKN
jgi:uncharacterized protein (TIGR02391 family)